MKFVSMLLSLLISASSYASCKKPIVIAVVDTGMGFHDRGTDAKLCKYGHKDFTHDGDFTHLFHTKDPVPFDSSGHGTNIVGIIDHEMRASGRNYCIVVLKVFSKDGKNDSGLLSIKAFKRAAALHADIINYSATGVDYMEEEKTTILSYINKGGVFVTATGNNGLKMGFPYFFYPAMYDKKIISVSNVKPDGSYSATSNYGAETYSEIGDNVEVYGITLSGTSQATAKITGKIAATLNKRCDK